MIKVKEGMKLRRLTRHIGFFGFEQGQVYTFKKNPFSNGFITDDGSNSRMVREMVSEVDWEVVSKRKPAPPEPTSIIIVVGEAEGKMSYGVFFEEKKAISHIADQDKTDVYRFYENGTTEGLTPLFIDGKIRLVASQDVEIQTEEETK